MVIPLIVVPLTVVAGTGVAAAGKGALDMVQAQRTAKSAQAEHAQAADALEERQSLTHEAATRYGEAQLHSQAETIGRFADWLEKNGHQVERLGRPVVGGSTVTVPSVPKMKFDAEQARLGLAKGFGAVGAGAAARSAALFGVHNFAAAGTGTAISSLSGAAANSAALAWLGGGTLAAGGGGVAAGAIVLNMIAVAPAALITGFALCRLGARSKTNATDYAVTVAESIQEMKMATELLGSIETRLAELQSVLARLDARATDAIEKLESLDFDADAHGLDFVRALQLVTAIGEVIDTPVLHPDSGQLTDVSIQIVRKYS